MCCMDRGVDCKLLNYLSHRKIGLKSDENGQPDSCAVCQNELLLDTIYFGQMIWTDPSTRGKCDPKSS